MFRKLKVYAGAEHQHTAQQPHYRWNCKLIAGAFIGTEQASMIENQHYGTGRRKTATARVFCGPAPARSPSISVP
jgi:hypothetical protein